jgi:hypothetical protein
MIRQAHTYLAGAVSSTALVAAAVVAFVLLVSLQALKEWPLAGISVGGGDSAASAPSNPGTNVGAGAARAPGARGTAAAPAVAGRSAGNRDGHSPRAQRDRVAVDASPTAATGSPTAEAPPSTPAGEGGSVPSDTSPTGSASSNPASGGGGGGSGPGAETGSGSSAGGSSKSTSGAVTGTVNKTVSGVDETTGGVISGTGATEVTEGVVNGVAGPESTVGKTVDEVVKTVNCLLGCK